MYLLMFLIHSQASIFPFKLLNRSLLLSFPIKSNKLSKLAGNINVKAEAIDPAAGVA